MGNKIDVIGERYGRLVVLREVEPYIDGKGHKIRLMECQCDCGNKAIVRLPQLRSGGTQSCGCLHKEIFGDIKRTHGLSGTKTGRLYPLWKSIRYRCNCPSCKSYKNYGGRGIKVCPEWDDFQNFYKWALENGYTQEKLPSGRNKLTIDRIDNDGDYSPDNCRFVTDKVQALNKRDTLTDEERYAVCPICGKDYVKTQRKGSMTCSVKCGRKLAVLTHPNTKDYTKICPICGKSYNAQRGGHYNDAVYCSRECQRIATSPIWEYNGESLHVVQWAEKIGINAHCLHHRKELGWTIEEILTTPKGGKRVGIV